MVNHRVAVHAGHRVLPNLAWQCDPRAPHSENTPSPPCQAAWKLFHVLPQPRLRAAPSALPGPFSQWLRKRINGMSKQRRLLTPVFLKMGKYHPRIEGGFKRLCEAQNSFCLSETGWRLPPPTVTASHLLLPLIYPSYPMSLHPSPSLVPGLVPPLMCSHNTTIIIIDKKLSY